MDYMYGFICMSLWIKNGWDRGVYNVAVFIYIIHGIDEKRSSNGHSYQRVLV